MHTRFFLAELSGVVVGGLIVFAIFAAIALVIVSKVMAARALYKKGKEAVRLAREFSASEGGQRIGAELGKLKEKGKSPPKNS